MWRECTLFCPKHSCWDEIIYTFLYLYLRIYEKNVFFYFIIVNNFLSFELKPYLILFHTGTKIRNI